MDIASYEERSDPASLRMEKNWKRPYLYLKTESQNWEQWTIKWLEKIKWKRLRSRTWTQCKENNKIWNLISVLVIITPKEISAAAAFLPLLLRRRRRPSPPLPFSALFHRLRRHNVEIQPKIRYKRKQNETHYENITH